MSLPNIPSAEQTLKELSPLTEALYEIFPDIAANRIVPYFRGRSLDVNRTLFACMIRYEVGLALQAKLGIDIENDDEALDNGEVSIEQLANNGIAGVFAGYHFKILKSSSEDGQLPVAGSSIRRKSFYGQQMLLIAIDQPLEELRPNAVILWNFESNYTRLRLWLSVPREGGESRKSTKAHYTEAVPHPITSIGPDPGHREHAEVAEPDVTEKRETPVKEEKKVQEEDILI